MSSGASQAARTASLWPLPQVTPLAVTTARPERTSPLSFHIFLSLRFLLTSMPRRTSAPEALGDRPTAYSRPSRAVLPPAQAQLRAVVLLIPIALLSLAPYFALWGLPEDPFPTSVAATVLFLLAFVAGTALHEALHGLGHVWGEASWSNVQFGMHWGALTPFARCPLPSRARSYRLAVALPGLVLGVLPLAAGLWTGHWLTTFYGFLMLVAAAGDLLVLWILRGVPSGAWVQDHPEEVGCIVVADASAPAPDPVSPEDLPQDAGEARDDFSLVHIGLLLVFSAICAGLGFLIALS